MRTKLNVRVGFYGLGLLAAAAAAPAAHGAQTPYRNLVIADGATAYYEFEEAAGATTAVDSVGGDNNGTFINVVLNQNSKTPILGKAGAFDANSPSRVRIPDAAQFDLGTGAATIELWYQTTTTARGDLFTYKGAGGDFGVHSESEGPNTASYYLNGFIGTASPAPANAWHHFVGTRSAAGAVSVYVDGALTGSGTKADTLTIANDILIGANHGGDPGAPALAFTGLIDEVAWYPVALSQAQVQAHFAASVPEPTTVGVIATAAAAMALGRRRRQR